METKLPIAPDFIRDANAPRLNALEEDFGALGRQLRRRGIDIEKIERQVAAFTVALPSWGAGRGGTRFAKFPFKGAPTNIHEKL
jgi:L-rhamnose isomerase / sugar isomerase